MVRRLAVAGGALLMMSGLLTVVGSPTASASQVSAAMLSGAEAAVLPSAGCGTTTAPVGEEARTLTSSDVERSYTRNVPAGHGSEAMPLLIAFHGLAEGAVVHALTTEYAALGATEGFVTVFPQALGSPVRWNTTFGSADAVFAGDLLDELEETLCIDTNRIYVSGYSNGAFFASTVACTYADRIAAFAPVAGLRFPTGCAPSRPVPIITLHGTVDPLVPFATLPPAATAWAAHNGCDPTPTESAAPGDEVVTSVLVTYDCADGAPLSYYRLEGAGHGWQGSEFSVSIAAVVGYTTLALSNTEIIWDFFEQQALHRDIVAYTARVDLTTGDRLDRWAGGLGITTEELVALGVAGLRSAAERGEATATAVPAPSGNRWVTVTWPAAEGGGIEAAAQDWGVTPEQLHVGGARLVLLLLSGRT